MLQKFNKQMSRRQRLPRCISERPTINRPVEFIAESFNQRERRRSVPFKSIHQSGRDRIQRFDRHFVVDAVFARDCESHSDHCNADPGGS